MSALRRRTSVRVTVPSDEAVSPSSSTVGERASAVETLSPCGAHVVLGPKASLCCLSNAHAVSQYVDGRRLHDAHHRVLPGWRGNASIHGR